MKTSKQIRTSGCIKSYRACRHATGVTLQDVERGRRQFEEGKLAYREAQRLWRNQ
jgi:hypothetical protein